MVRQVAQHPGQIHFRVSGLEAALHRGLDPALGLRLAHALAEEIGIAAEVLGRGEGDRVDPVLDRDTAAGVGVGPLEEGSQVADHVGPRRVHRRGRNARERDGLLPTNGERLEIHATSSPRPYAKNG